MPLLFIDTKPDIIPQLATLNPVTPLPSTDLKYLNDLIGAYVEQYLTEHSVHTDTTRTGYVDLI